MKAFCLFCIVGLILPPAFAAPSPAGPLTGDVVNEPLNSTVLSLFNLSTTLQSSLLIEKDPWDMPVLFTTLILEWYAYRAPLNATDAARCVEKALGETAARVMMGDDHIPMGSRPYSYSHGAVNLWLKVAPGKNLLWGIWARIVELFPTYGDRNKWRGAQFLVFVEASGAIIASGHLSAE